MSVTFWLRQWTFLGEYPWQAIYGLGLMQHFAYYYVAVRDALKKDEHKTPTNETYEEVVERHNKDQRYATYFNTNPILRLQHVTGMGMTKTATGMLAVENDDESSSSSSQNKERSKSESQR